MSGLSEKNTVAPTVSAPRALSSRQWAQVGLLTAGALALYAGFRVLPTGTNLNHVDFRTGGSPGSLEMCDPSNPQFIPVVAVRSPVSMTVTGDGVSGKSMQAEAGRETRCVVRLLTASGKPIGPEDLLVAHTRKLHLLIVDPSLEDYQHVHPEAGERAGEWVFAFTPRRSGLYRIFADFTPVATGRGLYASADMEVAGGDRASTRLADDRERTSKPGEHAVERGDHRFELTVSGEQVRAGEPADIAFTVRRPDGGEVRLEPVMDAYAHLVAFDQARSGFAHLHPNEVDLAQRPDAKAPRLTFKITIPKAGTYTIWAQVSIDGVETFVPFALDVR